MNLKVLAASLLFIAIMAAAISTNFSGFIDAISATFVLVERYASVFMQTGNGSQTQD